MLGRIPTWVSPRWIGCSVKARGETSESIRATHWPRGVMLRPRWTIDDFDGFDGASRMVHLRGS